MCQDRRRREGAHEPAEGHDLVPAPERDAGDVPREPHQTRHVLRGERPARVPRARPVRSHLPMSFTRAYDTRSSTVHVLYLSTVCLSPRGAQEDERRGRCDARVRAARLGARQARLHARARRARRARERQPPGAHSASFSTLGSLVLIRRWPMHTHSIHVQCRIAPG